MAIISWQKATGLERVSHHAFRPFHSSFPGTPLTNPTDNLTKLRKQRGTTTKITILLRGWKRVGSREEGERKSPGQRAGSPAEPHPSHFSKAWGPWGRRGRAPSCDDTPAWGPMVWEGRSFHKPGEEKRAEDHPRLSQHPPWKADERWTIWGSLPMDNLGPLLAPTLPRSCWQRQMNADWKFTKS